MKEQNELLEVTEKLLEILATIDALTFGDLTKDEWRVIEDAHRIVEQHRPKPKRLEGWANFYKNSITVGAIWPTEQVAKNHCLNSTGRQIYLREVVPVEWEPWTVEMVRNHRNFQESADRHNAEMEKVTK